jgi:hypothetical protein
VITGKKATLFSSEYKFYPMDKTLDSINWLMGSSGKNTNDR